MAGFLTADEAFANTNRILKIQPEWLSQILSGTKRIEIRNSKSPHKGWISLAETGSKRILGRANLIESHPVTEAERLQNAAAIEALQNYKEHWAWVLSDVEVLPAPIPIPDEVAHGCVRWSQRRVGLLGKRNKLLPTAVVKMLMATHVTQRWLPQPQMTRDTPVHATQQATPKGWIASDAAGLAAWTATGTSRRRAFLEARYAGRVSGRSVPAKARKSALLSVRGSGARLSDGRSDQVG